MESDKGTDNWVSVTDPVEAPLIASGNAVNGQIPKKMFILKPAIETVDLTEEEMQKIDFAFFSASNRTRLSFHEATNLLVGIRSDVTEEEVVAAYESIDAAFNKGLSRKEIKKCALSIKNYDHEKNKLLEAFRVLDRDSNGMLVLDNLKNLLTGTSSPGILATTPEEMAKFSSLASSAVIEGAYFDYMAFVCKIAFNPEKYVVKVNKKRKGRSKKCKT